MRAFVFQHLPVKFEHFSPIQQCIEVFVHVIAEQIACDSEKWVSAIIKIFIRLGLFLLLLKSTQMEDAFGQC